MGGGEVVKKGALIKSPPLEGGGGMKTWRKRWFCLRSSKVLEYYKKEGGELKGVINLEDCVSIHSALFHKKYRFVFDIKTKDRIYYLVAASADDMMSWVEALCSLCSFSSPNQQPHPNATTTYVPNESIPQLLEQQQKNELFQPRRPIRQDSCPLPTTGMCPLNPQQGATPGMPLTQALICKGLATGDGSTETLEDSESFAPHPVDQKGYLHDMLSQMYDTPKNNTLAPPTKQGTFSTAPVPDPHEHYARPTRSWTTVSPSPNPPPPHPPSSPALPANNISERAHTLANGYMVPRLNHHPPRHANYDYPPPPRPANVTSTTSTTQATQQDSNDPINTEGLSDLPTGRGYINFSSQAEGPSPPPVDRTTKPYPPRIDRSTKPDRRHSFGQLNTVSSPPRDISVASPPPQSIRSRMSQASSVSSEAEEPFIAADIPRPIDHSVKYTQVTFKHRQGIGSAPHLSAVSNEHHSESQQQQAAKKPIPAPRTKQVTNSNYSQIDLAATNALRCSGIEEESSSESSYEEDGYLRITGNIEGERETQENDYTHFFPSPTKMQES